MQNYKSHKFFNPEQTWNLSLSLSLSQKWKFSLFFLSLAKRIFSLYKITPWLLNFLYIKILSLSRKLQKRWEKRKGGGGGGTWPPTTTMVRRASQREEKGSPQSPSTLHADVHEIYKIKYSHIYIFSLTFM